MIRAVVMYSYAKEIAAYCCCRFETEEGVRNVPGDTTKREYKVSLFCFAKKCLAGVRYRLILEAKDIFSNEKRI